MDDPEAVGRTLQSLRLNLGLTQAQLAKRVGVKPSTIYRHENGSRSPDTRELSRLLGALCVTWAEFQGQYAELERYRERHQGGESWRRKPEAGSVESKKQLRLEEEAADALAAAVRLALMTINRKLDRQQ